jgi:NitT/TauT family transport system ATP-binding protein
MTLFACSGIRKLFPLDGAKRLVLDDISFTVEPGEVVVLVGKSGCGKSTLLRILAGLLIPDEGEVFLEGQPLRSPTPRVSILFQSYTVFPWMSVLGNVEAGLLHRNLPRKERRRIAEVYLELVGLTEFARASPATLSGGMQQRVSLARTYGMDSKVLLMDEPFGALDAFTRRDMQQELLRINSREGKAVVFVTHDIEEAVLLGSRILVLASGPGRVVDIFRRDDNCPPAALHQQVAESLQRSITPTISRGLDR